MPLNLPDKLPALELLKEENFQDIKKLVPETTYEFLISPQGKEIGEKLKSSNAPH